MLISAMLAQEHNIMKIGSGDDKIWPCLVRTLCTTFCFLLATACAPQQDIGKYTNADANGLCEAKFGVSITKQTSFILAELPSAEDVPGAKWKASLCNRGVAAELFVDSQGLLESIQFSSAGQCLNGICMGERYDTVVTDNARWKTFLSEEEGGIFTARQNDATTYLFDTRGIPLDCFADKSSCPRQIAAARVTGILLRSAK